MDEVRLPLLPVREWADPFCVLLQRSDTKTSHTDTRHAVESVKVRNSVVNIHLPFDDLPQNALPGIPVPQ
jgi:hypothetical protein